MKNHYYELKFVCDESEMSLNFHGGVNLLAVREHIINFLKGSGWHPDTIDSVFELSDIELKLLEDENMDRLYQIALEGGEPEGARCKLREFFKQLRNE
jgi:hypothetical protein